MYGLQRDKIKLRKVAQIEPLYPTFLDISNDFSNIEKK